MGFKARQAASLLLIAVLIINLVFLATKRIPEIYFWLIIAIAAGFLFWLKKGTH